MTISKIALAGCFVLAFAKVATADEVRVNTGSNQDIIVQSDDNLPKPHREVRHEDHDADYWRRHHHHDDDHHHPQVDIDINR